MFIHVTLCPLHLFVIVHVLVLMNDVITDDHGFLRVKNGDKIMTCVYLNFHPHACTPNSFNLGKVDCIYSM